MIPVYVINLTRSPERRAFMADQLARARVTGEFVAAVDARACRAAPARLSGAERALILSHRKVWRRLLRRDADFAIVLEDDVHLGADFVALVAADWRAHAFDAVKLETLFQPVWIARAAKRIAGRSLAPLGAEHLGAAGYLVSRAGARKMLSMTRTLHEPVDQTLFGRATIFDGRLRILQLVPAAVVQDNLMPDTRARAALATTLHEPDRARLAEAARRDKPRGLARLLRELGRLRWSLRSFARFLGRMSRERIAWR